MRCLASAETTAIPPGGSASAVAWGKCAAMLRAPMLTLLKPPRDIPKVQIDQWIADDEAGVECFGRTP